MKRRFKYYLVNKILSIGIFIVFYLFLSYLQEINYKYLLFNIWEKNSIVLIINLIFGFIIGWFLLDDIKIKLNRYQNIATICILIVLSLYQYIYYFPIRVGYLSPNFFNAVKYPQLILGMYLVFYLQKIYMSRKRKKKGMEN